MKTEDYNKISWGSKKHNKIIKISITVIMLVVLLIILAIYIIIRKNSNAIEQVNKIKKIKEINRINLTKQNEQTEKTRDIKKIAKINQTVDKDLKKKYEALTKKVQNFEKSLRKITKKEIEQFRNDNSLGILYDNTKYKRSDSPVITIVTTLYNQAHCIHKAIRSVQNQSIKNIEMIIVDDCSLDNSTETVEELIKDDERIIFIKHHDTNKGVMITRNEGIRLAKGKYILMLDPDDTLGHKDILNYSLCVANMADLDVVEFWTAYYSNEQFKGYYHYHGYFPILFQPELRTKFIQFNDDEQSRPIRCRTVWGKIVKNEILQKTLDSIPSRYLYDYILGFEDTMITFSLYQVAKSYYCLRQIGYYYTLDERRNKFPLTKKKKCLRKNETLTDIDHIKFMQFLLDKLDDNKLGKQILYHEIKAINNYSYSNFKRTITHHFDWAYSIFDYVINSTDITDEQRKKLQKIKEEIKENERMSKNNNGKNNNSKRIIK